MADPLGFDAADVAAEILGLDEDEPVPTTPSPPPVPPAPSRGHAMGWLLVIALIAAVSIAISLALQLSPESSARPEPPTCGGLYSECCDDRDADQRPCIERCDDESRFADDDDDDDDGRGLFDAEETFAERNHPPRC